jgi:cell division protein FtsQ
MKKTGSKRGSGYDDGLGSAVLEAPEQRYAPASEARAPWQGRGPAPAGALQRGYGGGDYGQDPDLGPNGYGETDDLEYVPKRENFRLRYRGLPRSVGGRIVLGVVAFCAVGACVVVFAAVRRYMLHDPRFVVETTDDIQINGAEHLKREQVLSVFGPDLERNIFKMSLAERRADIERLPWVAHATVMRLLPNDIRVQIKERTPVAFVRQGTQIGLVDGSGVLLDMPSDAAGDPHYSFPVLTGLSADLPLDTRAARMQVYEQFMKELRGAEGHLTDSLSEVDVSDPEDVKALIASGNSDILVHFGNEQYLKRYREFEDHLAEWKQQYPQLASADMRYEGQIVLEMHGGAGGVQAGDGSPAAIASASEPSAASLGPGATKPVAHTKGAKLKLIGASVGRADPKRPAAKLPTGNRMVVARPDAKKKAASGRSQANARVFAALAAAHKAAVAKETAGKPTLSKATANKAGKSGGPKVADGVNP